MFADLSPALVATIRAQAPQAVDAVWRNFQTLCPTWDLVGEERQVHTGENFLDPPDFNAAAFSAWTSIESPSEAQLAAKVDLPWAAGDLYFISKLSAALRGGRP